MAGGVTKLVWRAQWKGNQVVFINCSATNARKRENCANGMSNMEQIPGKFVTRLIGRCPENLQVSHVKWSDFLLTIQ